MDNLESIYIAEMTVKVFEFLKPYKLSSAQIIAICNSVASIQTHTLSVQGMLATMQIIAEKSVR